ncbi:hypothetical protein SapgrDRAFT_2418 [Saprospira grandis DSM 2844]|uniref:PD-(D/E)XK nuclease superfamily protein n=1 Tax=Saprospira grandis DSM 2844 TaxID=694433 RepID=J1I6Q6_9BACT|nr:PD-(D/E)XK nuclease family protein [Saprospira grandis]EJF54078.1 hypothetical protein SapgrDRAFT_2418 [Saprospira grandis DSM 2844]
MEKQKIESFLETAENIAKAYLEQKARHGQVGFNIFQLISKNYHQENFHSDVMAALLDPANWQESRPIALLEFIHCLNQFEDIQIDPENYQKVEVFRESGRIDILIKDSHSKHAIIVENKINGAEDMYQQIPRYLKTVENSDGTVDAVVYIPLADTKQPSFHGWTEEEKQRIQSLLVVLPATHYEVHSLIRDWLNPAILASTDSDLQFTLRHYKKLIQTLSQDSMNTVAMEDFYDLLKKGENWNTANTIKGLLEQLEEHRATRIRDYIESIGGKKCFDKIHFFYCKRDKVWFSKLQHSNFDGKEYWMEILSRKDSTTIRFSLCDPEFKGEANPIELIFEKIGLPSEDLNITEKTETGYNLRYDFPNEEEKLYKDLDTILSKMNATFKPDTK